MSVHAHRSSKIVSDALIHPGHPCQKQSNSHAASMATTITETTSATSRVSIKSLSLKDFLSPETRAGFLIEMRESLMEIGTFYIKDHGIPPELTASAMKVIQQYFALPLNEKKKMLIGNSRHFRGYKLIGQEFTNDQVDHREQLQFGPERPVIESFKPTISPDYEGLQGPNQWPASTLACLPDFKSCVLEFMNQLEILSQNLMEAIALSLGLEDASYFRTLFGEQPYYRLKCAKYPSVDKPKTIGCGAHKDTGFLTVLLQDMVGGLQGQDPVTGQWMDTRPIQDTFIVTLGESMEKLTGGLYHATVHRVLNNTSGQDRYSIPFFYDPALDVKVPHYIPGLDSTGSKKQSLKNSRSTTSMSVFASDAETGPSSDDDDLERLMDTLDINHTSSSFISSPEGWSNGDHIFETVHKCHPEVYTRWYGQGA